MNSPTILVLGSGRAALEAAKEVVAQHGRAVLVRSGGTKACVLRTPSGIECVDNAEIIGLDGSPGRFIAHLQVGDETMEIPFAAAVLADNPPLPLRAPGPISTDEAFTTSLPERMHHVAIVLEATAPRSAYLRSLELALRLRARSDHPEVTLFVKDMMVYGKDEVAYAEAQRQGVRLVRSEHPPELTSRGRAMVRAIDSPSGLEIMYEPDLLVVESGAASNVVLPIIHGAGKGHVSMGVTSSMREGVFMCRDEAELLDGEVVTRARAAATKAMSAALHPVVRVPDAAVVDKDKCSACLTCVRTCPFHAPQISDEGKAVIVGELCQACGICVAACPSRALRLPSEQGGECMMSSIGEDVGE